MIVDFRLRFKGAQNMSANKASVAHTEIHFTQRPQRLNSLRPQNFEQHGQLVAIQRFEPLCLGDIVQNFRFYDFGYPKFTIVNDS